MVATVASVFTVAGYVVGVVGALLGAVGWLTGKVRESIADQRDQDIESQGRSIDILKSEAAEQKRTYDRKIEALEAAVKACEERDADKATTIANLSSQIESADALIAVAKKVALRLDALEAFQRPEGAKP